MIPFFESNTANEAWLKAYDMIIADGDTVPIGRGGETKELLHANFHICDPRQRWILSREPALNPAFAVAEVFWILAGENDASFLNYWNPKLPQFSGEGEKYHGAYGYRLRKQFGFDQLEQAYNILKNNPSSRQVVLQIWDPSVDMPTKEGLPRNADIPCNLCAIPKIRKNKLEWLQIMRSNDLYLGVPHNFIQFSTIQEVLAGWLGLELGSYHHVSDSLHIYEGDLHKLGANRELNIPLNTDNLSLDKENFEIQLGRITDALNRFTSPTLNKDAFGSIIHDESILVAYKNLLLVAAADCARRRCWKNEMEEALLLCQNFVLKMAFKRWNDRYPLVSHG